MPLVQGEICCCYLSFKWPAQDPQLKVHSGIKTRQTTFYHKAKDAQSIHQHAWTITTNPCNANSNPNQSWRHRIWRNWLKVKHKLNWLTYNTKFSIRSGDPSHPILLNTQHWNCKFFWIFCLSNNTLPPTHSLDVKSSASFTQIAFSSYVSLRVEESNIQYSFDIENWSKQRTKMECLRFSYANYCKKPLPPKESTHAN